MPKDGSKVDYEVELGVVMASAARYATAENAMDHVAGGHQLADVAAIIGTMDIVFGEIDR